MNNRGDDSHEQRLMGAAPPSAAFSAFLDAYRATHADILRAVTDRRFRDVRLVTLHPAGQMANRLMAMASSFMLAALSGRALVVHFDTGYYASLSDLFEDSGVAWSATGLSRVDGPSLSFAMAEPYPPSNLDMLMCGNLSQSLHSYTDVTISSNQYFMPLL